jgi:hypothetical protein
MAIESKGTDPAASTASVVRRFTIGANVIIAIVLVAGIVAVVQAIAYAVPRRWDMTSSGVNSLSDGTENLLRNLDQDIRLTSLYFETDLEEADQRRYRSAVQDLLALYASTNRGMVSAEWVNPLSDHDKFKELTKRLRDKPASRKAIADYAARIDVYSADLDAKMRAVVATELEAIASLGGGLGEQGPPESLARVEFLLMRWRDTFDMKREEIDALTPIDNPQYAAAANSLKSTYTDFIGALKNISEYGAEMLARNPGLAAGEADFLRDAGNRYATLIGDLEAERTQLQDLEPLESDDVLMQLTPTGNAVLVETDEDASVVDFASIWPPLNEQQRGYQVSFENRAFKGEEKITAAILRVTHKEQTAVVFVRYGGQPLFLGGFMPNQPRAPYSAMKQQLEDANFMVEEWDLKTSTDPPEIDPVPTRTIYVIFKPTPPPRSQFGQPSQEPPFAEPHRRAILGALGNDGRALFVAGWAPGPFGPVPSTYEYNDHLKDTWGMNIDTSALLIEATEFAPGKFGVANRFFYNMKDFDTTEHDIVRGARARELVLPWCAPIDLSDTPPEGVEYNKLVVLPRRTGIWGVKDLQKYEAQFNDRKYLTKEPADLEGPFDLGVAATKGDAKVVVVGSREFAVDSVAFAREFSLGSQGFTIRSRNPGNVTLLLNSLHWLNDNTEFMNVGQPIDTAVLEIDSKATERSVQILTMFVWPGLALCCGGVAWWVRRR